MQKKRKKELLSVLAEIGITDAQFEETGGKHVRIIFFYKGEKIIYIAGGSPSDWRANLKLKCDLKRMMRAIDTAAPPLTPVP